MDITMMSSLYIVKARWWEINQYPKKWKKCCWRIPMKFHKTFLSSNHRRLASEVLLQTKKMQTFSLKYVRLHANTFKWMAGYFLFVPHWQSKNAQRSQFGQYSQISTCNSLLPLGMGHKYNSSNVVNDLNPN